MAYAAAVQAQRREAWGKPPPNAVSSVVRPRPHGRSAFARRAVSAPPLVGVEFKVSHGKTSFKTFTQTSYLGPMTHLPCNRILLDVEGPGRRSERARPLAGTDA